MAAIPAGASNLFANTDKFALRVFNWIAHDRKISCFLAANTLLKLPEFYTSKSQMLKKVATHTICCKFPSIIFSNTLDDTKIHHKIGRSTKTLATLFENYECKSKQLKEFFLFDYIKFITIVSKKNAGDVFFTNQHSHLEFSFQHPLFANSACHVLISLVGFFSTNGMAKNIVRCDDTE